MVIDIIDNTRIRQMEQYMDDVLEVVSHCPDSVNSDPALRAKIQALTDYYDSGLWLQDYDRDARGELPSDLKRGVLSQDALYDLLCEVDRMSKKKNIFIEGIQGSGKSTLLQAIHEQHPEYTICREGDYSPVELAWCAWMTAEEYGAMLERYDAIREEIQKYTCREEEHYIVCYTRIITDIPGFHKDLERYEIYNGRKPLRELEEIVLRRYEKFRATGYLFECSFFQNIVEDLILYHQLSDEEILAFYRRLFAVVQQEDFKLLYLYNDDLEESIHTIRKERSDDQGRELWYPLMMEYLRQSPYGMAHGYRDFGDLIAHLQHRQQVELRIIKEVLDDYAVVLPAKRWKIEEVEKIISER